MVFCSKRFYDLRLWKWVTIKFLNRFDIKLKQTERNPLVSLYIDILMLLSLPTHKHISSFMQLLKNSWNQHSVVYNIKTSHMIFVYLVKSSMSVCLFEDYMIFFSVSVSTVPFLIYTGISQMFLEIQMRKYANISNIFATTKIILIPFSVNYLK